jgi:hypothetical protein
MSKKSHQTVLTAFFLAMLSITLPTQAELMGSWSADGHTNDALGENNGTLIGDATYAHGKFGQAFDFDGDEDGVHLGYELDTTTGFSFSSWVNPRSFSSSSMIFNNEGSFEISLLHGKLSWAIKTDTLPGSWFWVNTGITFELNEWQFVGWSYDGSAVKTYDETGDETSSISYNGLIVGGSSVRIGARSNNNASFDGFIDEVKLYNDIKSGTELSSLALNNNLPSIEKVSSPTLHGAIVLFGLLLVVIRKREYCKTRMR